jgi:DNA-binding beta-propeller fold protein YncE
VPFPGLTSAQIASRGSAASFDERTVGGYGSKDGEFSNPHDVEAAADGSIWVVDSGNDRVQVFDASFKHRASLGPALKLNSPKYLAFDAGRVWVADEYNHRILQLDGKGQLVGMLGTGKRGRSATEFYKPEAVLARAPHVWVIDTYNSRVVLLRVD